MAPAKEAEMAPESGANGQRTFAPYVRALCVKQRKPRERMRRPKRGAGANGRESERLWLCVKYFVRGSRCIGTV